MRHCPPLINIELTFIWKSYAIPSTNDYSFISNEFKFYIQCILKLNIKQWVIVSNPRFIFRVNQIVFIKVNELNLKFILKFVCTSFINYWIGNQNLFLTYFIIQQNPFHEIFQWINKRKWTLKLFKLVSNASRWIWKQNHTSLSLISISK